MNQDEADKYLLEMGVPEFKQDIKQQNAQLHIFEETPPISTYIYAIMAGRFQVFTGKSDHVLMRIFASQSKAPYVDAEELFRVTEIGIRYYENFFGVKFPFSKYDQIFVPELRIGAMENVGAVTFNDNFLKPPQEKTDSLTFQLSYILLHELAHMWFGDLVTMRWWNDLWLKESFADFMSVMCLTECKEELMQNGTKAHIYGNPEIMQTKFIERALFADVKQSSTHPILVDVNHTIDAVNVFDDICYEKGACFIKTLKNYIGQEALMAGVKEYFSKFKFQNTETIDFIDSLQSALEKQPGGSQIDLRGWTDSWIKFSGANGITPIIKIYEES